MTSMQLEMGSVWSSVVTVIFEYQTIKTLQIKCALHSRRF